MGFNSGFKGLSRKWYLCSALAKTNCHFKQELSATKSAKEIDMFKWSITVHWAIRYSSYSLLLLIKCYNLYQFLACSTTFFQLSLFCATFFQLHAFMFFMFSKMSSSQCVLGLPIGLLDMGFHLLILCTILSSAMRSTWPNQCNLCFLKYPSSYSQQMKIYY